MTRVKVIGRFSEADKRRILDQAGQHGVSAAEIARRYGIDRRVLRRWKQELVVMTAPTFVAVQITGLDALGCVVNRPYDCLGR